MILIRFYQSHLKGFSFLLLLYYRLQHFVFFFIKMDGYPILPDYPNRVGFVISGNQTPAGSCPLADRMISISDVSDDCRINPQLSRSPARVQFVKLLQESCFLASLPFLPFNSVMQFFYNSINSIIQTHNRLKVT